MVAGCPQRSISVNIEGDFKCIDKFVTFRLLSQDLFAKKDEQLVRFYEPCASGGQPDIAALGSQERKLVATPLLQVLNAVLCKGSV